MAQGKNSLVVDIICDACGERKPHTDVCFDMEGCSHLLCFGCLSRQGCAAEDGVVACPVAGCVDGFLDQRNWEEGGEDEAKEEENKEAEEEEEERGDHEEPPEDSFSCPICMEEKRQQEGFFGTSGCAHLFCSQCIAAYVEARVEENLVPIGCPDPGCEAGKLEPDACRAVIPPGVFERWGAALCEGAVAAQARFYCPYRDCSALLANEGDEEGRPMTESECLHCQRTCCAQCRVPWHEGQSCVAYREAAAAAAEEGLAKLMELAKASQWQKCPKCGFMVDRVDGCVFIRCRCQHCFCYRCASPMDAADNRHFCAKCGLTWDN